MAAERARTRLVVLFGGVSAEHDVSCTTAAHVLRAVDPERYELVPVAVTTEGEWVLSEGTAKALAEGSASLPPTLSTEGPAVDPLPTVTPARAGEQVVVFPLIHGPLGEDGTVQGLLELADVAYVGSGVLGSALCMDKAMAKVVTGAVGITQPRHLAARDTDADHAFATRVADELGFPVFVKPSNLGSSIGITKAHDAAALRTAMATALAYDEWVLVEEAVVGREIEVAVLGNADPDLGAGRDPPSHDFYDYDDKYIDGNAELLIPAPLRRRHRRGPRPGPPGLCRAALRRAGPRRLLLRGGRPGFLLNEVNTLPGFVPISMYPSLWQASGVGYPELVDELVRLAVERHVHRRGHGRPRPTAV
ncbi:MAG: D-alanine--D-alanine ligase family protein [Acidimicrobiales bacterium]